jgi:hypothetical protein
VLFRTSDHNPASADDLGWGQHFRKVRLVHVDGSHESLLLPPHLSTLREKFVHAVQMSSRGVANRAKQAPQRRAQSNNHGGAEAPTRGHGG